MAKTFEELANEWGVRKPPPVPPMTVGQRLAMRKNIPPMGFVALWWDRFLDELERDVRNASQNS